MAESTILIVDDEKDILELLRYNLTRNGYRVVSARTGEEALGMVRLNPPELIVLDLMLPGMDGLDVCRELKRDRDTAGIPVIMLTAKGEETDIVAGLELGAHDYVCKPFSPKVLVARVRACLRNLRAAGTEDGAAVVRIGALVVDPERHAVTVDGEPVELTFTEFRVLHVLASKPGRVFTRNRIIEAIHDEMYAVTERAVDVQIVGLRKKLGSCGSWIETIRGVGYRFREP